MGRYCSIPLTLNVRLTLLNEYKFSIGTTKILNAPILTECFALPHLIVFNYKHGSC